MVPAGSDNGSFQNSYEAMVQLKNNPFIALAITGSILSIAFFNFFGVSITKYVSAGHRATVDACRTLFVWIFSLSIGWEDFHWLMVLGFVILVSGTFMYHEVIRLPRCMFDYSKLKDQEAQQGHKKVPAFPFVVLLRVPCAHTRG